jgi:radical SAM family uncharacterized protein/radical SAM-linked protein
MDLDVLRTVDKPARYMGGEVNQIRKDLSKVSARVGLCYPDVYEIGMSHIGLKILYETLNARPEVAAERVYAPWPDMETVLRNRGVRLSTLENNVPLHELHVLGFTLQYELSYSNLVNVLDLGGVPLRAAERGLEHPVVIGGGPTSFNPEPLAAIVDAICLGDAEELIHEVVDAVMASKAARESRLELWIRLSRIQGVYVPGLYEVHYQDDGTIAAIVPRHGAPAMVSKRVLMNLDQAPYFTRDLVPNMEIVHDRYGVEVQRGCMRGCRFCQAGYIYRPERQRSPETVRRLVREGLRATGTEEYSLLSLSLGDYNCVEPLLLSLMDEHADQKSAISTPSMRLESLSPAIMDQIGRVRKTSFTVAPEAGSNRLRAVINKVIDEDVLIEMVKQLFSRGWRTLKLYFMLGLPTETDEDLLAMVDLAARCRKAARQYTSSPVITVSVSSFVPKSHTPFQWSPQISLDEIHRRQSLLARETKRAKLNFRRHEATSSIMEGVFSRGDRRTGEALLRAHQLGARMDGWQEYHDLAIWDQALAEVGLDREFYNARRRDVGEILPWDHIDCGVLKEWLWDDWMTSLEEGEVPDCSEAPCYDCGVCDHQVVHNSVFDRDAPGATPKHRAKKAYIKRSTADLERDLVPLSSIGRPAPAPEPGADADPSGEDRAEILDVRLPKELRTKHRIHFAKRGVQAVSSHFELTTQFHRAFKRNGVPAVFTAGMHPRMRTSMSPPIPAGAESEAEYLDLEVRLPYSADALRAALVDQLPAGIEVLSIEEIGYGAPSVTERAESVVWSIRPPDDAERGPDRLAEDWASGRSRHLEVTKRRITRTVDLAEQVVTVEASGGALVVEVRASVQGGARLREVLSALCGGTDPFTTPGWRVTKQAMRLIDPEEAEARRRAVGQAAKEAAAREAEEIALRKAARAERRRAEEAARAEAESASL